jgi:hypothetical protein
MQPPSGVFTWSEAAARHGAERVRWWVRTGAWVRLDRGLYASADVDPEIARQMQAFVTAARDGLVVVRESAAQIHGFGVLRSDVVQLAGDGRKTARARPGVRIHGYKVPRQDVVMVAGVAVSSPARTAIDLARFAPRLDALAVVDAALHVGACNLEELTEQIDRQGHARGIVQARDIVRLADGRAESPMESRLRLRVIDGKVPPPEVQYWVCDERGRPVYRLDLAWPEYRLGLEYDGIDHLSKGRQRTDLERRSWLLERGWRLVSVTDRDVYQTYVRLLARLRRLQRTTSRVDHAEIGVDTPGVTPISA